ncbi:MAG: HXXEE domain-containing protein [Bacteroidia bacterium]
MALLRKHWFDLGGVIAFMLIPFIYLDRLNLTHYQLVMWLSLATLLFHQLEEYRIVGTFPGMMNKVMFNSSLPDRYPLNTNSALFINVFLGWTGYTLAALFAEKAIWLGIATLMVSIGNIFVHTVIFNIKGKTFYNAGMATSLLLFVPVVYYFLKIIYSEHLVNNRDYIIGISLGIIMNLIGVLKVIDWMKDRNTSYIFPERCLLKKDRG